MCIFCRMRCTDRMENQAAGEKITVNPQKVKGLSSGARANNPRSILFPKSSKVDDDFYITYFPKDSTHRSAKEWLAGPQRSHDGAQCLP